MTRVAVLLLIPAVTILAMRDRAREAQMAVVATQLDDAARAARDDAHRVRQLLLDRARVAFAWGDCAEAGALASVLERDYDTDATEFRLAAAEVGRECRKRLPQRWEF